MMMCLLVVVGDTVIFFSLLPPKSIMHWLLLCYRCHFVDESSHLDRVYNIGVEYVSAKKCTSGSVLVSLELMCTCICSEMWQHQVPLMPIEIVTKKRNLLNFICRCQCPLWTLARPDCRTCTFVTAQIYYYKRGVRLPIWANFKSN